MEQLSIEVWRLNLSKIWKEIKGEELRSLAMEREEVL